MFVRPESDDSAVEAQVFDVEPKHLGLPPTSQQHGGHDGVKPRCHRPPAIGPVHYLRGLEDQRAFRHLEELRLPRRLAGWELLEHLNGVVPGWDVEAFDGAAVEVGEGHEVLADGAGAQRLPAAALLLQQPVGPLPDVGRLDRPEVPLAAEEAPAVSAFVVAQACPSSLSASRPPPTSE